MVIRGLIGACVVCAIGGVCAGQVLYEAANTTAPASTPSTGGTVSQGGSAEAESATSSTAPAPAQSASAVGPVRPPQLSEVSLIAVAPPEPPSFQPNDLITIIISERSQTQRDHTFDSKKQYDLGGEVTQWIDMGMLLQARLQQGNRGDGTSDPLAKWAVSLDNKFKGDASYERDDSVTARVTARVVEVKPNGTLLLEARSTVQTDTDKTSIVLSGMCRTEDVTDANTVQSNQMFDLHLDIQNPGDTRNGAAKGLIPKMLETLFNY